MRRAVSITTLLGIILAGATCRRYAGNDAAVPPPPADVFAPLPIWLDPNPAPGENPCKLVSKTPPPVYATNGGVVRWVVVGSCAGHTVGISGTVKQKGQAEDSHFFSSLTGPTDPAQDPRIVGHLNSGKAYGGYKYTVIIDGQPAQYASLADAGDLFVCPYPCQ